MSAVADAIASLVASHPGDELDLDTLALIDELARVEFNERQAPAQYAWTRGSQVGTSKTGQPIYNWTSDTPGQSPRQQITEPLSGHRGEQEQPVEQLAPEQPVAQPEIQQQPGSTLDRAVLQLNNLREEDVSDGHVRKLSHLLRRAGTAALTALRAALGIKRKSFGSQLSKDEPASKLVEHLLASEQQEPDEEQERSAGTHSEHDRSLAGDTEESAASGADRGEEPVTVQRVPASQGEVNRRLDRFEKLFRSAGNTKLATWIGQLKAHINVVGTDEALRALGEDAASGPDKATVQYAGVDTEESPNWASEGDFIEAYLNRYGIIPLTGRGADPSVPVVSSQTNKDPWGGSDLIREGDVLPVETPYDTKLQEAKDLPGLESSEDVGVAMGHPITHVTPDVMAKLDEKYGAGQWLIKTYSANDAFGGKNIFFPARLLRISQDARNAIWYAGESLAQYDFKHLRELERGGFGNALQKLGSLTLPEDPQRERWEQPPEVQQDYNRKVLDAAASSGLLISPDSLSHLTSGRNVGGLEHDVFRDDRSGQYWKLTKDGHFGQNRDLPEYLARHAAANELFPSLGYRFHGITRGDDGSSRAVVSMNELGGEEPSQQEVEDWFNSQGWEPLGGQNDPNWKEEDWTPDDWTWRDPHTGTVIRDAHGGNFRKTADGGIAPIDVDIHPGEALLKSLSGEEFDKVTGIRSSDGKEYRFGTDRYDNTISGDVRHFADRTAVVANSEKAAALPSGGKEFMVQPAFPVVGVSEAERAEGKTIVKGEGRVHVTTRGGKVQVIPHSTWIKDESLPVVFENDETRAMARVAEDAINKLPENARKGQVFGPDLVKTADGYRVVELNASVEYGGSGYLSDNPFIIDAYVSHMTGREPAHVSFIRKLLTVRKQQDKKKSLKQSRAAGYRGSRVQQYAWTQEQQVGTSKTGKPVYRWTSDTPGQHPRDQTREPLTGREPGQQGQPQPAGQQSPDQPAQGGYPARKPTTQQVQQPQTISQPAPASETSPAPEQAVASELAGLQDHQVTGKHVQEWGQRLHGMTVADLASLRKQLKVPERGFGEQLRDGEPASKLAEHLLETPTPSAALPGQQEDSSKQTQEQRQEPPAVSWTPQTEADHVIHGHLESGLTDAKLSDEQCHTYRQAAHTALSSMSEKARERFSQNVKGFSFHARKEDIYPAALADGTKEIIGNLPREQRLIRKTQEVLEAAITNGKFTRDGMNTFLSGLGSDDKEERSFHLRWAAGVYWKSLGLDRMAGGFLPTNGKLYLDGGPKETSSWKGPERFSMPAGKIAGLYSHEFAHGVDGIRNEHSSSSEWQAIHDEEIKPDNALTEYAGKHTKESWAEFGRLVYGRQVPLADVEKTFPRASAYWRKHGLWSEQQESEHGNAGRDVRQSEAAESEQRSGRRHDLGGRVPGRRESEPGHGADSGTAAAETAVETGSGVGSGKEVKKPGLLDRLKRMFTSHARQAGSCLRVGQRFRVGGRNWIVVRSGPERYRAGQYYHSVLAESPDETSRAGEPLRHAWQQGQQVGVNEHKQPVYDWHSDTGETRRQAVEPGTGRQQAAQEQAAAAQKQPQPQQLAGQEQPVPAQAAQAEPQQSEQQEKSAGQPTAPESAQLAVLPAEQQPQPSPLLPHARQAVVDLGQLQPEDVTDDHIDDWSDILGGISVEHIAALRDEMQVPDREFGELPDGTPEADLAEQILAPTPVPASEEEEQAVDRVPLEPLQSGEQLTQQRVATDLARELLDRGMTPAQVQKSMWNMDFADYKDLYESVRDRLGLPSVRELSEEDRDDETNPSVMLSQTFDTALHDLVARKDLWQKTAHRPGQPRRADAIPLARPADPASFQEADLGLASDDPEAEAPSSHLPPQSRPQLTDTEVFSLRRYGSGNYNLDALREDKDFASPADQEMHEEIQKAMAKVPRFPSPVPVLRGVDTSGIPNREEWIGKLQQAAKNRGIVTMPGYSSSTASPDMASVSGYVGDFDTIMHIQADWGLDMKPYSGLPEQYELLINHNSKFRVTGFEQRDDKYHIEMEQVHDAEEAGGADEREASSKEGEAGGTVRGSHAESVDLQSDEDQPDQKELDEAWNSSTPLSEAESEQSEPGEFDLDSGGLDLSEETAETGETGMDRANREWQEHKERKAKLADPAYRKTPEGKMLIAVAKATGTDASDLSRLGTDNPEALARRGVEAQEIEDADKRQQLEGETRIKAEKMLTSEIHKVNQLGKDHQNILRDKEEELPEKDRWQARLDSEVVEAQQLHDEQLDTYLNLGKQEKDRRAKQEQMEREYVAGGPERVEQQTAKILEQARQEAAEQEQKPAEENQQEQERQERKRKAQERKAERERRWAETLRKAGIDEKGNPIGGGKAHPRQQYARGGGERRKYMPDADSKQESLASVKLKTLLGLYLGVHNDAELARARAAHARLERMSDEQVAAILGQKPVASGESSDEDAPEERPGGVQDSPHQTGQARGSIQNARTDNPLQYTEDQEGNARYGGQWIEGLELARLHARLFTSLEQVGTPPTADEIAQALREIEPTGWSLRRGEDRQWHVVDATG